MIKDPVCGILKQLQSKQIIKGKLTIFAQMVAKKPLKKNRRNT